MSDPVVSAWDHAIIGHTLSYSLNVPKCHRLLIGALEVEWNTKLEGMCNRSPKLIG